MNDEGVFIIAPMQMQFATGPLTGAAASTTGEITQCG